MEVRRIDVPAPHHLIVTPQFGTSVPIPWRRRVRGWPGLHATDLIAVAVTTARADFDEDRWPAVAHMAYLGDTGSWTELAARHPHDNGVLLGTCRDFRRVDELDVDAVVSLRRIGIRDHAPASIAPEDHITVWLLDSEDAEAKADLDFVLGDTAQAIADLRREGGLDYMQGSLPRVREIAPDKSARSAPLGGIYVASTYPHVDQFVEAMTFAAAASDGDSVGAVTGALLGASHGASQRPVDLIRTGVGA